MARLVISLAVTGCAARYKGQFADGASRGECLDVRVTSHRDDATARERWVGVRYELGNRCRSAVAVDLSRVRVVARGSEEFELARFDPDGEVRAAVLDGGRRATETLAYLWPARAEGEFEVCVDLGGAVDELDLDGRCFLASVVGPLSVGLDLAEWSRR